MQQSSKTCEMLCGAAGGLIGTLAMQPVMAMVQRWFPEGSPPLREDPGKFMVAAAESGLSRNVRRQIPTAAEVAAARSLAVGYGVGFGALFGATCRQQGSVVGQGIALGAVAWAVGYLGWLPAAKLMRPVWQQKPAQTVVPFAEHLIYGIATAAVCEGLSRHYRGHA